ncbi:hypothetical protein IAQ61_005885 [Plenodomus lingam]|uniref:uncharacterized protein n=1 Tax=Leptosphaeria maculans TaxID=5022 RepID=UPI0033254E75|nr:hypothetical protein IAQ61_005885 [Plenodomus lingam]
MVRPGLEGGHEIIELSSEASSENEDERGPDVAVERCDAELARDAGGDLQVFDNMSENIYQPELFGENDDELIDLTAIPDVDVPSSDHCVTDDRKPRPNAQATGPKDIGQLVTESDCLQMVLNVFPDISIDHALKVINEKTRDATRTVDRCELLIAGLLDGEEYPKEADESKNRKRKRDDDDDDGNLSDYERGERDENITDYEQDALNLLKDEFLNVPIRHLSYMLKKEKTLFKAFGVLEEQLQTYKQIATPFAKIAKPRVKHGTELILIERGSKIPKELHAAKRRKEITAAKRQQAMETDQAEEMNLRQAQIANQMGECACCFDDLPLNRMISCNGRTAHFYCMDCPRQQIETLMGQSRCRPTCFGVTDCNGTFSRTQLQQVLSEKTFERLEHMQQMEDLKAAGLDFLSECPFCDFKMECPPVNIDKEFRCEGNKCGKTSCRLCNMETHIPLSCEEAKKEGKLTFRHIIEEAMSSALIRHCNQCRQPFVKEMGCNKMTCSHCRNVQCYVCSKNVTGYDHFGEFEHGKCPLHENIEDRHEEEVKKAADEAMTKLRAENPDLSEADLMIKVSDRVKQVEDVRKGRAAAEAGAFPFHMVGEQLHNRALPRPHPPVPGPAPLVGVAGIQVQGWDVDFHGPPAREQAPRPAPLFRPPAQIAGPLRVMRWALPGYARRARNLGQDGVVAERVEAAPVPNPNALGLRPPIPHQAQPQDRRRDEFVNHIEEVAEFLEVHQHAQADREFHAREVAVGPRTFAQRLLRRLEIPRVIEGQVSGQDVQEHLQRGA